MNRKSNTYRTSRLLARIGVTAGLAVGLSAFCTGASAAEANIGARIATGVGQVIAAQGNAALMHIREELGDTLQQTVDSFLPAPTPQASDASIPTDTAAL